MTARVWRGCLWAALVALAAVTISGCASWRGVNSMSLPGTEGNGPGSYEVQAQLPDVTNIQQNSRVRVGDVTVGHITKIERQDWHALVTMQLNGDVVLPANATAKIGQTSLLGTLHVELAPPTDVAPKGRLTQGSLIPLASAGAYPNTEQTLGALSVLLNGGGLGQVQDITREFTTAFSGRENDVRSFLEQLNVFIGHLDAQKNDLVTATESLNNLAGQFAAQDPVVDKALRTIPDALTVLKDRRDDLTETVDQLGKFGNLAADSANQTKQALVAELKDIAPVLDSLANAGPSLTRSLSSLATLPWPNETLDKWFRGDYGNSTLVLDLTLSRIDRGLFTGTRWEGDLTELEMQWGRTIGQLPSPYTAGNPLVAPYRFDQGS
ncbi:MULTISPECIES: MCE family protein [unclassified Mycobacterium]|uniref:MCE family protein n=1 Tax=unclassified Mycobacterium TaxID=2642494 RepID=UPI0029C6C415|nr:MULTISPECIES: MCE family protein [unclassified Mycobacterium]